MSEVKLREYQLRKKRLRDMWIVAGILMLPLPTGAQVIIALLATFVSFAYLDERPYSCNH